MKFVNRVSEQKRLTKVLERSTPAFVVIYGRRRCGKSRLIRQILQTDDLYFMADQSEAPHQRALFAKLLSNRIPGFDRVLYPDWETLLESMGQRLSGRLTICIDEFPYLVKTAPELPSVLQKIMERKADLQYSLILCGSSQQLMRSLVMGATAPLFGRADEIMNIKPMAAPYLQEVLSCTDVETIEEYSVWGGVPRYWELRRSEDTLSEALLAHLFSSQGILYDEPLRLFLDDMRDTVHSFTILSLVASGCHRLSEIASRLGKPATSLAGPLDKLVQLGYIMREIPFGEAKRSSKKSLYKIADPFLNFYFRFVVPNRSIIEIEQAATVLKMFAVQFPLYVSGAWEELCRRAIPLLSVAGVKFQPASRWWGSPEKGVELEIDIVAESLDGAYLLVGECKWSEKRSNPDRLKDELLQKVAYLPFAKGKTVVPALFLKHSVAYKDDAGAIAGIKRPMHSGAPHIFGPKELLEAMRN